MSLSERNKDSCRSSKKQLTAYEMCVFAMLAAIMLCSKLVMEALPNIHMLGTLTVTYTVVYRKKALIPIYLYVFLNGLISGFSAWWVPYLYIWTLLWGAVMLLPKNMSKKAKLFVYPIVCAMHGFLFGTLYAPAQAIIFGFNLKQMLAWIVAGFSFDVIHGIGNFCIGLLILPLSDLLIKIGRKTN